LHLNGITSTFGPFYTTANSVGLAMATGNVGTELSTRPDEINTYFSRDGGLNWYVQRRVTEQLWRNSPACNLE